MANSTDVTVRPLEPRDLDALYGMILELAEFEKLTHLVTVTPDQLARDAFGAEPKFFARVAEKAGGELLGYAVYSLVYATFTGTWLYLDDLYVRDAARKSGVGKALIASVAEEAIERGCFGMQWFVLDWNEKAIRFYDSLGAAIDRTWLVEKVRGKEAMLELIARVRKP